MPARPHALRSNLTAAILLGWLPLSGCAALEQLAETGLGSPDAPGSAEIVSGLKQALSQGAGHAVERLAREGGYLQDPALRIPFPEEAQLAADALNRVGLGELVSGFERRLNEGASAGAERALPIFEQAILQMTFADAREILFGAEQASTNYFRDRTYEALATEFRPELEAALAQTGAIRAWSELSTRYNQIPLINRPIETDIVRYATTRALDGLFLELGKEEARIRADPLARSTALLERVFGYAARNAGQR